MEQETLKLNAQAQKFSDFLDAKEITCFNVQQAEDDLHTAVFRSTMEVGGSTLPVALVLDDSIYGMLRVQVVPQAVQGDNKAALLEYINTQNRTYKVFKYYLAENGALFLDSCILLANDQENGPMIYAVIEVLLKHLQETYPALMRTIWGK